MLDSLGLKKSFAIYTAIDGVLLLAAYFMVSERRKPSQRKQIVWFDKSFFTDPVFWSLGGCFLFTVFGYLSPVFFLPTFAQEKLPNLSPLVRPRITGSPKNPKQYADILSSSQSCQ